MKWLILMERQEFWFSELHWQKSIHHDDLFWLSLVFHLIFRKRRHLYKSRVPLKLCGIISSVSFICFCFASTSLACIAVTGSVSLFVCISFVCIQAVFYSLLYPLQSPLFAFIGFHFYRPTHNLQTKKDSILRTMRSIHISRTISCASVHFSFVLLSFSCTYCVQ